MKRLALFDFDGTITTKDTLFDFIRFVVGDVKLVLGLFVLSPMLIAFKLKLIPNYRAKEMLLSYFFKHMSKSTLDAYGNKYALTCIEKIIRSKALEKLQWHKNQNHTIVIVSASIDCWLQPWCDKEGIQLISTKLHFENNIFLGRLDGKNCHGREKVSRLHEVFDLSRFSYIYAYGDSHGDRELLDLADKSFYKPFRT